MTESNILNILPILIEHLTFTLTDNTADFIAMKGMEATMPTIKTEYAQQNTPNSVILKNCLMKLQLRLTQIYKKKIINQRYYYCKPAEVAFIFKREQKESDWKITILFV